MKSPFSFISLLATLIVTVGTLAWCSKWPDSTIPVQSEQQQQQNAEVQHYLRKGQDSESIGISLSLSCRGEVCRGEYSDAALEELMSIPVVAMLSEDEENQFYGRGIAKTIDGSAFAYLDGGFGESSITRERMPLSDRGGEYRFLTLESAPIPATMQQEMAKYPKAFYNTLFPDLVMTNGYGKEVSRMVPFIPEDIVTPEWTTYGYKNGEWEQQYIHIKPWDKEGEVDFNLYIFSDGYTSIRLDVHEIAQLDWNTFRHTLDKGLPGPSEEDYTFEVSIFTDFVAIKTIEGVWDRVEYHEYSIGEDGEEILQEDRYNVMADGIYPLQRELNFYAEGIADFGNEEEENLIENQISLDILSLPEMQYERAAVMIVSSPSETEPYYTVKAGSDMDDQFVTVHWFHVYTQPQYMIKVYDIVSDREMDLNEWRYSDMYAVG